ncbi:MAG: serine/threonine-protein kinase [Verrucomicrobiota bacterium]
MPERTETIAYCHSCGSPMNVAAVAPFSNVECPTCGKHTRVKREFGPYTLVRRHAVGGMSMVFAAHDNTLDREVALKILSEDFSADEKRIAAFEEEARITASFSHPHVVRVLRTGKSFGRFYIAMELVPGGHFEHQIRERGSIPEVELLPLAIEVAQGLKAAHSAGLIHRDVKPGNILLDAEGHAKLVDFGLALVTQGGKAQAAEVWATPYYVPPETIEGYPEDFRSDVYAFGATLYHALAGFPSCGEETMSTDILREAKRKVVPLGVADPSLSEATCRIVERAMAYDPKDRFSSYDELLAQLESALKRLRSSAAGATESSGSAARRRAKKKEGEIITLVAAGLVVLAAVSGGIWWIIRKEPVKEQKKPLVSSPTTVVPESSSTSAVEIAKSYREARAAVEARDFTTAAAGFVKLSENPDVQEPTRTWAGVEAVLATYLDGKSSSAKERAAVTSAHAVSVPENARIGAGLIQTLDSLSKLPAIPAKDLDASGGDASHLLAWMLAGLKNWEQGMTGEACGYFSAVAAARISPDETWLAIYQSLAADYLADHQALVSPVFEKLPADAAGCDAAVAELDKILPGLKTRGRARFNIRAWQLDLAKHAKLLSSATAKAVDPVSPKGETRDQTEVMGKLDEFAKECRFTDAAAYLKSLTEDGAEADVASLISVANSSAVFLTDLEADLAREAVTGVFLMKSGETVVKISSSMPGSLVATDANGLTRSTKWRDFSPDALISLHRYFVKNPKSEPERLRRHECAISYDWLAGNRERALNAATLLSQGSVAFKQRWDAIASGLPK